MIKKGEFSLPCHYDMEGMDIVKPKLIDCIA